jgi:hypothetical protein
MFVVFEITSLTVLIKGVDRCIISSKKTMNFACLLLFSKSCERSNGNAGHYKIENAELCCFIVSDRTVTLDN